MLTEPQEKEYPSTPAEPAYLHLWLCFLFSLCSVLISWSFSFFHFIIHFRSKYIHFCGRSKCRTGLHSSMIEQRGTVLQCFRKQTSLYFLSPTTTPSIYRLPQTHPSPPPLHNRNIRHRSPHHKLIRKLHTLVNHHQSFPIN